MSKTYLIDAADNISVKMSQVVEEFVTRYGGGEPEILPIEHETDKVRVYEVPPGVVILLRPGTDEITTAQVLRVDILGNRYTPDGIARMKELESRLDEVMTKG